MSIADYINRGRFICKNEGILKLTKQAITFLKDFFYICQYYYLYEKDLVKSETFNIKPRIDGIEVHILKNISDYNELNLKGYSFNGMIFDSRLRKECIAFCLFINKELAHVTWVAFNNQGKAEIDYLPFCVNYDKNEVCSGASFTEPKFRGNGLFSYVYSIIFPYLTSIGVKKDIFTIGVNNISSNKAMSKFNPRKIGKYRYLKILWWKNWQKV